jgi:large subunit ribosomal protein L22e
MVKAFHKKTKESKKQSHSFQVDCSAPTEDGVFVISDFQKFLKERVKVSGKTGNLGTQVAVSTNGNTLQVDTTIPFSKRYIKYLTKKYLKQQKLREYLRVVSSSKNGYLLKYFKFDQDDEE